MLTPPAADDDDAQASRIALQLHGLDHADEFSQRLTRAEKDIEDLKKRRKEDVDMLTENTRLTMELRDKLSPIVAMIDSAESGLKWIGRFGDFVDRWGGRLAKVGLFFGALYLGTKIYAASGSLSEAVSAFVRAIK